MSGPLDTLASIKVKLGALVAAAVAVATLLALIGSAAGVPWQLVLPVSVALALGVTQLLAAGMVAPLRAMTEVAQRMARGDYAGRVHTTATDEVGRLAAAFNQMAEDLATVDRERRDLIATVSHELRTPLSAMTALLENLADGVVPADARHLGEALDQAERLRALVADLLELSRLEAGVATLDRQQIGLHDLVADNVAQVTAAGRTGEYVVHVPAGLVVEADPARLRQLLGNVLDNAGRHSPDDAAVTITAGADTDHWWLHVTDAGPGVEPADRERVFERFGTDATGGGTGLGLAIARWVAQLHGGTLRFVDPPDGRGARLALAVPYRPTDLPEEPVTTTPTPPHPTAYEPPRPVSAPPALGSLFGRFWPEPPALPGLRVILAAAAAGLLGGAVFTFEEAGLSVTLTLLAAGLAALVTARHRRSPWTLLCAALAALLVLSFTLRDAEWISAVSMVVAAGVFLSGTTAARSFTGMLLAGVSWPLASLRGLAWFGRSLKVSGTGERTPAVVRTAVWSLLGLAVFGAIFASADALFASWVDTVVPNLTFGSLVARAFVACGVFALTLAAAYLALNPARVDLATERAAAPLANRFEWLVPVLVVDAVFVAFLAARATAIVGGHAYVEDTTGLTYADYVHQGFGQLTLATVLTLLVVWAASRRAGTTGADRWWLRGSLGLLLALTLVVVGSALRGMHVYQQAYGFTTLRLFVDVFEGWLGFVVLAVMVAGGVGRGRWLPRIALISGAVAVLGLGAVNPDAWVAGRNIDRFEATGRLDVGYLQGLSADAAPTIAERLPADVAACSLRYLPANQLDPARDEVLGWNLGRARAEEAVAGLDLRRTTAAQPDVCGAVIDRYAEPAGR